MRHHNRFLLILFLELSLHITTLAHPHSVGSTIFNDKHPSKCWTQEEIAKLRARHTFEKLIPTQVTPDKITQAYIKNSLRFYRTALHTAENSVENKEYGAILKEALADTIGGYLQSELLPTIRFAYYAGYVPYRDVRRIHNFFDAIKSTLNTQGIGWSNVRDTPQWSNLTVPKVLIGSGKLIFPCESLVTKRDAKFCMHLPQPKVDDEDQPTAIALPLKYGGLISLTSPNSDNILLKYYTTASRCILQSSPPQCRHSDFVAFNNGLWHWMKRDVAPHLVDNKLYSAYGGVLRVAAAVQTYGKGLSRRNLFDSSPRRITRWHSLKYLTQSYVYLNADWSPMIYIGLVLMAATAICILQICYNYMLGDNGCRCKGRAPTSFDSKSVSYANVDSNFPAMLPKQSSRTSSKKGPINQSIPRSRTQTVASMRSQRVYDFNDNVEKVMDVIASDNEREETSSGADTVQESGPQTPRSKSPPKIETPMTELSIKKSSRITGFPCPRLPIFSSSSFTRSDLQRQSDSVWSGTGSSTEQSGSSTSTQFHRRRTHESRDLAWARRVVSRHTKSTSATEFDATSFTTPPSRR